MRTAKDRCSMYYFASMPKVEPLNDTDGIRLPVLRNDVCEV